MEGTSKKIVVFGSLNGDIFLKVDRLPSLGETIASRGLTKASGGKGANQAAACGKLGANIEFLCQVGDDDLGQMVLNELTEANVEVGNVTKLQDVATGQAYILSQPDGENSIIIHGGANTAWAEDTTELPEKMTEAINGCDCLLLQREVPQHINEIAARLAYKAGALVILDAGGEDTPLSDELLNHVHIYSPNLTELTRSSKDMSEEDHIESMAENFPNLNILLKLGADGSSYIHLKKESEDLTVKAVSDHKGKSIIDTTGAGDTFTGAFAVELLRLSDAKGIDILNDRSHIEAAMVFANKAGFLCITKFGAMPSIPTLDQVNQF